MKILGLSTFLVPSELLPMFAVLLMAMAGIVKTFGASRLAGGLLISALMTLLCLAFEPLIAGLVEALIEVTPWWMLTMLIIVLILKFSGRFFRDVAVHIVGDLTSGLIRWTLTTRYGLSLLATAILVGVLWTRYG